MANTEEIKIKISAQDDTKQPINQVESSLAGLTGTVKKFAIAAGAAFAAKQVFDFGVSSVKAFAESEAAMARVSATVATLPKNLGVTADAVEKLSNRATQLGFSNEEAAINIANLTQRTGDLKKANELNNLAMDLARSKNIDLASAGNLVNLALSGNVRALKAYGIELDETKTPLEALEELQGKVKGQADAFADTTSGKLAILSESFGEFKEAIGASLADALVPLFDQLIKIVNTPEFIEFFVALSKVIGTGLLFAVRGVIGFTDLLATSFFKLEEIATAVADFFKNIFNGVMNGVRTTVEIVTTSVSTLVNALQSAINLASQVGSGISNTVKSVTSKVTGKRAEGGPVSSGGTYLVGEQGPELFTPRLSGNIIPNGRLGGGAVINITITGNTLLDRAAGELLAGQLMTTLKHNLNL